METLLCKLKKKLKKITSTPKNQGTVQIWYLLVLTSFSKDKNMFCYQYIPKQICC